MIDLHVHTSHSADSRANMEDYCIHALQIGVKCICFTDHVDFYHGDEGFHYYKGDHYFAQLSALQDKYAGELLLLSGMEFGEPHIYQKEFEEQLRLPYDFVLGSVHYWYENMFVSQMLKNKVPATDAYHRYWEEVYKAVTYGGFDALAHMDFPKRYYGVLISEAEEIEQITNMMVKNNIALEINTSSLRKGLTTTLPDREFLQIYESLGGVHVTLGSDAHAVHELANGFNYANTLIEGKLESMFFIKRKAVRAKDFRFHADGR